MTQARRYVVSSQLWLTIVRAGLCRRFGETKRDPARISETAGKTPVMAAFRIGLTRFNKIAIQGTPQMAVDKEAIICLSRVYSYYFKCNFPLFYV